MVTLGNLYVICIRSGGGLRGRPVGHVDSIINTHGYSLVARTCRCIKYERQTSGCGVDGGCGVCRLHTKCILLKRTFQNVVMNKPWSRRCGRG